MKQGAYLNIVLTMTPRDLREIADLMEEAWRERGSINNMCVQDWEVDDVTTVTFAIDRDRMNGVIVSD